jgi:outer membrane protein assembly factor BamB
MSSYTMSGGNPQNRRVASEPVGLPLVLKWRAVARLDTMAVRSLKSADAIIFCDDPRNPFSREPDREPATLYCVSAETGERRWAITQDVPSMSGTAVLPCVLNECAIWFVANCRHPAAAYDVRTGARVWQNPEVLSASETGVVVGSTWIVDSGDPEDVQHIVAVDARTGQIVWRQNYGAVRWVVAGDDRCFYMVEDNEAGSRSALVCADAADGREMWRTDVAARWAYRDLVSGSTAPGEIRYVVVDGDRLYCSLDGQKLACLSARTGREHWDYKLTLGQASVPIPVDGRVYFTGLDRFYIISDEGTELSTTDFGTGNSGIDGIEGVVAGSYYFCRAWTWLFVFSLETGEVVQSIQNDGILTSLFASDGCIYATSTDGHLYCWTGQTAS